MKKNSSLPLILTLILVVAAVIVWCAGGVQGKDVNGGAQVRINAHGSYDRAAVEEAMNQSGLKNPVLLESNRTAIEVQASAMKAEQLSAAAEKLLASVKATNPDAELVYAESFAAAGTSNVRGFVWALVGFAVLGFVYGWARFGWKKGCAAVLTACAATLATGSVCLLVSALIPVSSALLGILAGVAALTYLYTIVLYARLKEQPEYQPGKADLAVPALVVIVCVAVLAVGGASVAKLMCSAVLGSILAACFSRSLAPSLWAQFTPVKSDK